MGGEKRIKEEEDAQRRHQWEGVGKQKPQESNGDGRKVEMSEMRAEEPKIKLWDDRVPGAACSLGQCFIMPPLCYGSGSTIDVLIEKLLVSSAQSTYTLQKGSLSVSVSPSLSEPCPHPDTDTLIFFEYHTSPLTHPLFLCWPES